MANVNGNKKALKRNDEAIKATLEKLIEQTKRGIKMIETIDDCYAYMGEASVDGNVSEGYVEEKEKRNQMKTDLQTALNQYLKEYKERFGEYKEK